MIANFGWSSLQQRRTEARLVSHHRAMILFFASVFEKEGDKESLEFMEQNYNQWLESLIFTEEQISKAIDHIKAHWGLPVGFLLLRYSVLFTDGSLSLLYLLFYILIHMF